MKQASLFFAATSLAVCMAIMSCSSQTTIPGNSFVLGVFEASTPCDDMSKGMLGIPAHTKCELMKWNLTLYQDKDSIPSTYQLICKYGLPKQGTRDFMEGAATMQFKGRWTIGKGTIESAEAIVYKLNVDNAPISLSFLKPDQNILHLLDSGRHLMTGNGAWSYTLNRIHPKPGGSINYNVQNTGPLRIASDSLTVGVFDARTPCDSLLMKLNNISADGCQIIKCRLTLYQDLTTHLPSTFLLQTVYVGQGDTRYSNTGKWMLTRGTKTGPLVYQLDFDNPPVSLVLLKGDDNVLFFLDKHRNFMVGNNYVSYTFNRIKL